MTPASWLVAVKQHLDSMRWPLRWAAYLLLALTAILVGGALGSLLGGCASANDKVGEAALVGGGAAAGSAVGGPLWAAVVAGIASLWNWLGGDPEAAAGVTMSLGQKVGLFIDRALLWIGVAFAALILTWLAFPRSRALIWDMLSGLPKALYRACSGDRAGAAEAATNLVAAPLRLAGAVGEPVERRIRRDGSRILRQSRKSRSR